MSALSSSFSRCALAALGLLVASAAVACERPTLSAQALAAPYLVACGTKPLCSTADVMELRPIAGAAPAALASACLLMDSGAFVPLPLPAASAATTYSVPLAPLLREAVSGPNRDALAIALTRVPKAPLLGHVVMVDAKGQRWERAVELDTSSLWIAGIAPTVPALKTPRCEGRCGLASSVFVPIQHLAAWQRGLGLDVSTLQPMLDGRRLAGTKPRVVEENGQTGLVFDLPPPTDSNTAAAETWRSVLGQVLGGRVELPIAFAGDRGVLLEAHAGALLKFDGVPPAVERWVALFVAILVLALVYGIVLRRDGWHWLRDADDVPVEVVPRTKRSFSLARCQMAWWMLVVPAASVAIAWGTGVWFNVDAQALALMGMGAGTALAASAVVPQRVSSAVTAYKNARDALALSPNDAALTVNRNAAEHALREMTELRSRRWWLDITRDSGSDETGLHRLQAIGVTGIVGGYVLWHAVTGGAFPLLTTAMLALMGISGGAYVGFKAAAR